jgi:hypothetical protein
MKTKKLSLNELRFLIKKIIKEETSNPIRHKKVWYDDNGKEIKSEIQYWAKEYDLKGPWWGESNEPVLGNNTKLFPSNK